MEPMTQSHQTSKRIDRSEVLMLNLINARANATRRVDQMPARQPESSHRLHPRSLRPAVQ
jgi:hypothetical protein